MPVILIFVLAFTMMPLSPFMDKAYAEVIEEDVLGRSKGQVYIWDWDFYPPWFEISLIDTDDEYLYTVEDAGTVLRKQMVDRNTKPAFKYCLPADTTNGDVSKIVEDIFYDALKHTGNPKEGDTLYYGWKQWYASVKRIRDVRGQYLTVTYHIEYYTDSEKEAKLDGAVADLKGKLSLSSKNDYQKIKAIYDYMCKNIAYDWEHINDPSYTLQYTPYAALINKKTVCQGYATLFYRLALECGIDARVIAGHSLGELHAWNIVKLNGQYYYLDSTWDAGGGNYEYFLKGTNNWKDHTPFTNFETAEFKDKYKIAKTDYDPNRFAAPKLTATNDATTGKIKLSWNKVTGASGYEIYRSSGNDNNYKKYTTRSGSSTSYTDSKAKPGINYYYAIRTIYSDTTTKSEWGYTNRMCDLASPELKLTNVSSTGKVKLSWNSVEGATGYEIYRSAGNDRNYKKYTTRSGSATSYTDSNTKAGITYYYKVRAVYSGKSSANSAWVYKNLTCDLAKPKITVSATKKPGKLYVKWDKIDRASSYVIYRATSKNGTYKKYSSTKNTYYTNVSVTKGKTYYYKVVAVYSGNSKANSAYSNIGYAKVK